MCGPLMHDRNASIFGFRLMIDVFRIVDYAIYDSVLCEKKGRRARGDIGKKCLRLIFFSH